MLVNWDEREVDNCDRGYAEVGPAGLRRLLAGVLPPAHDVPCPALGRVLELSSLGRGHRMPARSGPAGGQRPLPPTFGPEESYRPQLASIFHEARDRGAGVT